MKIIKNLIILICVSLLFFSCVGVGTSGFAIDTSKISDIKKGETTKEDILKMFGTPQMTNIMSDSTYVITYHFTETHSGAFTGTKIDMQYLQIIILKETDVVKDYMYSENKM